MRTMKPGGHGSKIGFFVDPFRNRKIVFESGLEENGLMVLVASPEVKCVREQQKVVVGRPASARLGHYTIDALVDWTTGWRSATEFKYAADAKRQDTERLLNEVAAGLESHVADDFRIVTEEDLDETTIANARLIVACGNDRDYDAVEAVRETMPKPGTVLPLGEFGDISRFGYRGYRAAVSLVQAGAVAAAPEMSLSPDAIVTVVAR